MRDSSLAVRLITATAAFTICGFVANIRVERKGY